MSNEAITAVLRHSQSTLGARLVMLIIANIADHDGVGHPKIPYVCEATKLGRTAVHDALNRLEQIGELSIKRGRGRGNLSLYAICLPGLKGPDSERFRESEKVRIPAKKGPDSEHEKVRIPDKKTPTPLRDTIVNTIGHHRGNDVAREEIRDAIQTRTNLFDGYCRGVGIVKDSGEYLRRWNFASSDLPAPVLTTLTPDKLEAMGRYLLNRYAAGGIRKTPTLAQVVECEAEFDRVRPAAAETPLTDSTLAMLDTIARERMLSHEPNRNGSVARHAERGVSARTHRR